MKFVHYASSRTVLSLFCLNRSQRLLQPGLQKERRACNTRIHSHNPGQEFVLSTEPTHGIVYNSLRAQPLLSCTTLVRDLCKCNSRTACIESNLDLPLAVLHF